MKINNRGEFGAPEFMICTLAFLIIFTIGAVIGGNIKTTIIENEAIQRGYAEIIVNDKKERIFRWKDIKEIHCEQKSN